MYCDRFLPLEKALEFSGDEVKIESAVLQACSAEWKTLPRDMQLNIIRAYDHEKERLKITIKATKEIAAFRQTYNLNQFPPDFGEKERAEYDRCWPSRLAGTDAFGHVIMYDRIQAFSVERLLAMPLESLFRYRAQDFEALFYIKRDISNTFGHRVSKHVYILDLAGLEMKHFTSRFKQVLQPVLSMSSNMFPETLWSLWLINAPSTFRLVWTVVRSMLDPVVRAKVRMFGSRSKWVAAMQEVGISEPSLPAELGGMTKSESFLDVFQRFQTTVDLAKVEVKETAG